MKLLVNVNLLDFISSTSFAVNFDVGGTALGIRNSLFNGVLLTGRTSDLRKYHYN